MKQCASCAGCCGGCQGCGGTLELTAGELEMLRLLAQIPFLPVVRRMGDETPIYLEENRRTPEEYSRILQCLEKRGLISIDFDLPLKDFSGKTYDAYPIRGSFALTARGQQVVEVLEYQGCG